MSNQKYKFTTAKPGKKPVTYFKAEEELDEKERDLLYQNFAREWDYQPMNNKNRFIRWLVKEGDKLHKPELSVCPECQEIKCECEPKTMR